MKHRKSLCILSFVAGAWFGTFFIGSAHAADVHKARAVEDPAAKIRCRVATAKAKYDETLKTAKLDYWEKSAEPKIDWDSEVAVIVAPQIYVGSMELAFVNVTTSENSAEFRWDFARVAAEKPVAAASGGVISLGSSDEGPEILVVVTPKSTVNGKVISCRGPDRVPN